MEDKPNEAKENHKEEIVEKSDKHDHDKKDKRKRKNAKQGSEEPKTKDDAIEENLNGI